MKAPQAERSHWWVLCQGDTSCKQMAVFPGFSNWCGSHEEQRVTLKRVVWRAPVEALGAGVAAVVLLGGAAAAAGSVMRELASRDLHRAHLARHALPGD